jgi:hypothetical protein
MADVAGAPIGALLQKPANSGTAGEWQKVEVWPGETVTGGAAQVFLRDLRPLADQCLQRGHALAVVNGSGSLVHPDCAVALRLESDPAEGIMVGAFYLPGHPVEQANEALRRLQLITHTPGIYHLQRAAAQSQLTASHLTSVLDLMALLNAEQRFLAVAMTLCNEIAARHKCDRVSLGWLKGEYIRLQTISHAEKFERKMEAVRSLEQTMEESLDQDEMVVWPAPEAERLVTREHARFAENFKAPFLCSIPLRVNGEPVAVLLCERGSEAFEDTELRLLSLYCEMAARRLSELKEHDRWFGARWGSAAHRLASKALGVEHTWAKGIALLVGIALCILFFGRMTYRVEAPFILRTDDVAILSAPFDGFIEQVPVEIGDRVGSGDVLLRLDQRELRLEEAAALADLDRYTREAEKSRATNSLADMRIAMAQAEQSQVRLDLVRYRLEQSLVRSPVDGVVVEGDLKKRIAAPLKVGDPLFRVARLDRMYAECSVAENDIHEVQDQVAGEIAFASQPKLKFPVVLERIEPVAQTRDQKNVFVVRCQLQGAPAGWWRPGMSGVAKLSVGKRTFFWIISHRTVDFLRMYFWV